MEFGKLEGNDYNNLIMNIAVNAFRIAVGDNISLQDMVDMFVDEYEDETGIDSGNSINIQYDAIDDYYSMGEGDTTTIDNMEYATDGDAQTAYVANDSTNFQSYSEDTIKQQGSYSLKMVATQTDSLNDSLTKDFSAIDLTNRDTIKFQARATRIGTNFKIHFIKEFEPDSNTKLLLNFNGTDGDTSTTDESDSGHTPSFNGSAHIEEDQNKFGTTCLETDDSADYVNIPDHADWDFGTGDFTIECWIRPITGASGSSFFFGRNTAYNSNYTTRKWCLNYSSANEKINWYGVSEGNNITDASNQSVPLDQWSHIAIVRNSGQIKMWVNGKQEGSTIASDTQNHSYSDDIYLGAGQNGSYDIYFDGVRISNTARYTSSFIPNAYFASNIEIYSANTWETKEIDISSYDSAEKEDIEGIAFEIINADSANTIYIDELYAYANPSGYTLISENQVAESEPDEARIVILMEEVSSITLNTDLKAWLSKDDGSTFAQITLTDVGDYGASIKILYGEVDLAQSGIGSGTNIVYKITTHNSKNCKIHGTSVAWR